MSTITYCKGLPTPASEMNALGFTTFEMFLDSFAPIFHSSACETVNHLLSDKDFDKSKWNTHLQNTYGINKRHANGVISHHGDKPRVLDRFAVLDRETKRGVLQYTEAAAN